MEKPPINEAFNGADGSISEPWLVWINKLWMVAGSLDNSGVTVDRPTKGLYVGRPYFDTTLGHPIWLKSVRPTVWMESVARTDAGNTFTGAQAINASSGTALRVTNTGSGNSLLIEDSANPDSTPFMVGPQGLVTIGSATAGPYAFNIKSESSFSEAMLDSVSGSFWHFRRAATSLSSPSVVSSGNTLGELDFTGYDSAAYRVAASIIGAVDGAPGSGDMPGRLVFSTTADGTSSPTERLRISNTGAVTGSASYTAHSATAIPAGGTAGAGLLVSSTANFGVFFGSGVPTLSAAKGSLYLRSDGSSSSTRMYVNSDGATAWVAVTTAS